MEVVTFWKETTFWREGVIFWRETITFSKVVIFLKGYDWSLFEGRLSLLEGRWSLFEKGVIFLKGSGRFLKDDHFFKGVCYFLITVLRHKKYFLLSLWPFGKHEHFSSWLIKMIFFMKLKIYNPALPPQYTLAPGDSANPTLSSWPKSLILWDFFSHYFPRKSDR